jgi:hypothetical protein
MPGLPGPGLFGEESTLKTASANTYASFIKQWSGAKAWQRALQVAPRAACVGTSKDSLCAPQVEQGGAWFRSRTVVAGMRSIAGSSGVVSPRTGRGGMTTAINPAEPWPASLLRLQSILIEHRHHPRRC